MSLLMEDAVCRYGESIQKILAKLDDIEKRMQIIESQMPHLCVDENKKIDKRKKKKGSG